ncbi:MAG: hypothetical protein JO316_18275 [Abitibacteriaceae bacterium]|nr:hypothetical protein [Abditibacteriaceae bacterium]MBV9867307.1 hypothetical protein [Abditibacteriaceae bacterium]
MNNQNKKWSRLVALYGCISLFGLVMAGCGGGAGVDTILPPASTPTPTATPVTGNQFAGTYSGSYTGQDSSGGPATGTFTVVADQQGKVTGSVHQDQFGGLTFPATGVIDNKGQVIITVTGTYPSNPPVSFTTRLGGTARNQNGQVTASGTFHTVGSTGGTASGTFTATRTS